MYTQADITNEFINGNSTREPENTFVGDPELEALISALEKKWAAERTPMN